MYRTTDFILIFQVFNISFFFLAKIVEDMSLAIFHHYYNNLLLMVSQFSSFGRFTIRYYVVNVLISSDLNVPIIYNVGVIFSFSSSLSLAPSLISSGVPDRNIRRNKPASWIPSGIWYRSRCCSSIRLRITRGVGKPGRVPWRCATVRNRSIIRVRSARWKNRWYGCISKR